MAVWITQCLCPRRHCIMAAAFEEKDRAPNEGNSVLRQELEKLFAQGELNPWCGICYSKDLTYETRRTRFATMEEAMPVLHETEINSIATGMEFGEINGPRSPFKGNA